VSWIRADVGTVLVSRLCKASQAYRAQQRLYRTTDDGRRWQLGHLRPRSGPPFTESMSTDGTRTYRLAYRHSGCPGPCNPLLQTAPSGTDRWRTLRRVRSGFGASVTTAGSFLLVTVSGHPGGGAPDAHTGYLISADAGAHWHQRTDPCGGQVGNEWDSGAVAVSPEEVAAICIKRQLPHRPATIVVSRNQGRTFTPRERIPAGAPRTIAFAGNRLVVASANRSPGNVLTYRITISNDGGHHWRIVSQRRYRVKIVDITHDMLSCAHQGCALLTNSRHLLISSDSGLTWTPRAAPRGP
jgi:hypothetical protein